MPLKKTKKNSALLHAILKLLRQEGIKNKKLLVAVSAGVDSMVLLDLLFELRRILNLDLTVSYVHHGEGRNKKQNLYRLKAQKKVQSFCKTLDLPFLTHKLQKQNLKNEEQMRNYRYKILGGQFQKGNFDHLVLAHHREDLLATRMLQMIRGTGVQGFLSMSFESENKLRPLLTTSKAELKAYAKKYKIPFVKDPSNDFSEPLRNWIQNSWFRSLERKRKGSCKNLQLSFLKLAEALQVQSASLFLQDFLIFFPSCTVGLSTKKLQKLKMSQKKQILSQYFKLCCLSSYSRFHIEEVLKRLDSSQKEIQFKVLNKLCFIKKDCLFFKSGVKKA